MNGASGCATTDARAMSDDAQPTVLFHGAHKMAVCVPDRWDDEQVQSFAARENPLSGFWQVSSSRMSCEERADYVHIVLDG